jgi:hypothetical protein
MLLSRRRSWLEFALPIIGLAAAACGGDDNPASPAAPGILQVTTVTTGTEQDADGYSVQVDAEAATAIGNAETRNFAGVAAGDHTVQLSGMAGNCSVSEGNPRSVAVASGGTTSVTFAVTCTATTGGVSITSATNGPDSDPDGYTVSVDGVESGSLGINGTVAVEPLPSGIHTIGLTGVAGNCQIQGENLRSVAVTAGADASIAYAITCSAAAPGSGNLRISTATTGGAADPDGYTFVVDGGSPTPIAPSAATTLQNLAPGDHSVQLAGLSGNCSVQGTNPRPVTVTGGATASLRFAVTCRVTTGTISVNLATTGSPADPDGYVAKLDGADPGKPVGSSGSVSFTAVPAGSHVIELSGLAANCSAEGGPSKNATVTAGATAEVSFAVTCAANTGSILVTTTTTGAAVDFDGYTLSLDGAAPQPIGVNASVTLPSVTPGDHSVALAGTAANCTIADVTPRTVAVTAGVQATVVFTVTCVSAGTIQWTLIPFPAGFAATGLWASSLSDIFAVGMSPSGRTVLHYDGSAWADHTLPAGEGDVLGVWGSSPSDVYAASGTSIWHYNGTVWATAYDQGELSSYRNIAGISAQDVYAVGWIDQFKNTGLIEHYDGVTWSRPNEPVINEYGEVFDVSGTSRTDVYAVGRQDAPFDTEPGEPDVHHKILHYDGTGWTMVFGILTEHTDPTGFTSVWATAPNDVFAVGSGGHIWHFNGSEWLAMASPTADHLWDLWGSSGSDVFAVGNAGILRYDGSSWSVIDQRRGTRVWGAGTDLFVLAEGGVLHGTR